MILCPHCEEPGCTGSCRFRPSRRSFLGLGLGALAAAALGLKAPQPDGWVRVSEMHIPGATHVNVYRSVDDGPMILEGSYPIGKTPYVYISQRFDPERINFVHI